MARRKKLLGSVELLGLNEFGQASLNPVYGAAIGGGVAFVTQAAVARTGQAKNKELIGFAAGLASAGAMFAFGPRTRNAAFGAAIGATIGAGFSWIEKLLFGSKALSGFGAAQVSYLNGLGIPKVSYLNGLGIPSISNVPQSVGTIPGVAGPSFAGTQMGNSAPLNLLGSPTAASQKVSLMGGPAVHGLSASYGATLLGGGRG